MKPTQQQIDEQLALAIESEASGRSKYPGMTYEQGVRAALDWASGAVEDLPIEEE